VTGEHSGPRILPQQPDDNPDLAPALTATGVTWLGGDASRDSGSRPIGPAALVPRYPLNVFYNVATEAEEVDEYNWIFTSRADGGSGLCDDLGLIMTCLPPVDPVTGYENVIIPSEVRIAYAHILGNDPRPHFVHQSNLAEDRLLYPLLDRVLDRYRAAHADNTPLVSPTLAQAGELLAGAASWRAAVGSVTAYVSGGVVTIDAPAGTTVPITVPEGTTVSTHDGPPFGDPYAGTRSGELTVATAATSLVLP
jgi:hypothetical protein